MGDRWRPYSKGIFESVGGGRGGEREARRLPWIMPPCSQDGIISRSGTGDPIRCIDATIPQGFSMGLRKIRPVERCVCLRVGVLDLATNTYPDPVWIEIEEN